MEKFLEIFQPVSPNYVAMFARLFCTLFAIQMLVSFSQQLRYFKTWPNKIYGDPQKLLSKFKLPVLSETQFIFFGSALILSLCFVAVGILPRLFVIVALFCYFPYFSSILSLAYIQRKSNLLPFVLLLLAVSPSLSKTLNAPATTWEIVLVKIAIAQMYFSAGLQKIMQSGLSWCNGRSLQAYLLENYLWSDRKSGFLLAQKPILCAILSFLTLFFELTFWIVVFLPQLTWIYLIMALFFHTGTLLTMRINYLKYMGPAYMVFFIDAAFWAKDKLGI